MPKLIRARDNHNAPIVEPGQGDLTLTYFNLLRLAAGEAKTVDVPSCELLCVVLAGRADIAACAQEFKNIGHRTDIWDGPADSVYCGTCPRVTIRALREGTEVAVAGGLCEQPFTPFRIAPQDVEMVEVGSTETHTRRRVFQIMGQNARGRAGRLVVSEILSDHGSWSAYPPHKHDTEHYPEETDFEELYHYRFKPETGFGGQFCYDGNGGTPVLEMTRQGDTFLVDRGYHPAVTSPGHEGYIFAMGVGRKQRSLVQHFEPRHRHLIGKIPGIQTMRDKFM